MKAFFPFPDTFTFPALSILTQAEGVWRKLLLPTTGEKGSIPSICPAKKAKKAAKLKFVQLTKLARKYLHILENHYIEKNTNAKL